MAGHGVRWTVEAEESVRKVFAPWQAANKGGVVPRHDLRQLLQRLQPNFSELQLDEILTCGIGYLSVGVAPSDDVDLHGFLDWIFHPGDERSQPAQANTSATEASEPAGCADQLGSGAPNCSGTRQLSSPAPQTELELGRGMSATEDHLPTNDSARQESKDNLNSQEHAPQMLRSASHPVGPTGGTASARAARGLRGPAPALTAQTSSRRPSRGAVMRAQELFQQRLGAGTVQMTDQMLLRLTRQTSTASKSIPNMEDMELEVQLAELVRGDDCQEVHAAEAAMLRFGTGAAAAPSMTPGSCGICFEDVDVGSLCGLSSCKDRFCAECMRRVAETFVEGAFYAMPWLKCPGCSTRVPTGAWRGFVSQEQRERYLHNGESLMAFRCPSCHEVGTAFKAELDPDDTRTAASELFEHLSSDEARFQLGAMWPAFQRAEESAENFTTAVMEFLDAHLQLPEGISDDKSDNSLAMPPKLAWGQQRLLALVEDPERRCCLQLAMLRGFPKILTPCCKEQLCFKCKVASWHPGETCEERQRKEMNKDVQFCPKCGVPTVKSEGCDHIICVCGASWQWQGNPVANAIQTARIEVIEEMLNEGFDINSPIEEEAGETFLHYAARFRVLSMVTFLLERGADPTLTTRGGSTILMEALSDSHAEGVIPVTEVLLTARCDVNGRADYVANSLFFVIDNWERYYSEGEQHRASTEEREKGVPIVQLLLAARADVNQRQFLEDQGDIWDEELDDEEEEGGSDEGDDEANDDPEGSVVVQEDVITEKEKEGSGLEANEPGESKGSSGPTALLLAIQRRLPLIASAIICGGVFSPGSLDLPDDTGNRPLYLAVSNRNLELVEQLVAAGASVNAAGPENTPPLHEALRAGHERMVQLLLDSTADVNALDDEGLNALHCALEAAQQFDGAKREAAVALATMMVGIVNNVDLQTKMSESALGIAAATGSPSIVSELLRRGAVVDQVMNQNGKAGCTALGLAAGEGQADSVRLLLAGRAMVEARDGRGWTPLHQVAGNWEWEPSREDSSASKDTEDPAPSARLQVIESLLAAGASVDALTHTGLTPLLAAVNFSGSDSPPSPKGVVLQLEVVDALLRNRANVNRSAESGVTPLACACQADASSIVMRLLDDLADPNVMDSRSGTSTLLSISLERASKRLVEQDKDSSPLSVYDHSVEYLIKAGAAVNGNDSNGRTPVMALVEGATQLSEKAGADFDEEANRLLGLLVAAKADLSLSPSPRRTALELAATAGRLPLVKALLKHGAPVNGCSSDGSTPLLGLCKALPPPPQPPPEDPQEAFLESGQGQVLRELLMARADVLSQGPDGVTPLAAVCCTGAGEQEISLANAPAMVLLLRSMPEGTRLEGKERWQRLLPQLISAVCSPGSASTSSAPPSTLSTSSAQRPRGGKVLDVLEVLLPKLDAADVVGPEGESLLEILLAQLLFSATVVIRVNGADIERFNTEYRYARHHNNRPLFKSAPGAIIYWGGTQWRMNYCDKTAQSFYCAAMAEPGVCGQICTQLPPCAGVRSAAVWTTAGWRSQYRAADHSCPTLHIFKEVGDTPLQCGEAALACAKLLRANGIAPLGSGSDVPADGLLRLSALTSAAFDAQEQLTPLPGVSLGRSFHELLEEFAKAHIHADDISWDGDWRMGYYKNGSTWTSEIVKVEDMMFSLGSQTYKLTGNGHRAQCEWLDGGTLNIGQLCPQQISWNVSSSDGSSSSQSVVWARYPAALDEAAWASSGANSDPSIHFDMLQSLAAEASPQLWRSPETWRHRFVKIGEEVKVLRLETKQSENFPRAAVGAMAAVCLLLEESPFVFKLAEETCFEDCLRIIMRHYYLLHRCPMDAKATQNPLLADGQVKSIPQMQRHTEAALNEATLPQASISQAEALAHLLGDISFLGEAALVEAKDQRVTNLHAFVRDVAIIRGAITPRASGKPPVRWASLAQVTRLLDTALAGSEQRGLRDAWLQWLFSNLARPDIGDNLHGQALHLALRSPGLAVQSAALPLLKLSASTSEKDGLGLSANDLLRSRAADLLAALQRCPFLVPIQELAYATSLGPADAPDAEALAAAIAEVEEDASLGLLWQIEVLSKQEQFWSDQVKRWSGDQKDNFIQDGEAEDVSSKVPHILVATSPNGMCEPEGEYILEPELAGNGQPVWKKSKGMLYWMYSGKSGKWHLGSNECRNMNFNCDKAFLYRNLLHSGKMPHAIGGCWKRWDGIAKKWFDDPEIKITDCPPQLSHDIQVALDALYEIRPSHLAEAGRLDVPSDRLLAVMRAVMTILDPSESWSTSQWDILRPHLQGEERAAEFLRRVLEFGSTAISEAQSQRLQALLVEAASAPDAEVIFGRHACAALLQWARAMGHWQRFCKDYGADLAGARLATALVEHVSGKLKVAKQWQAGNGSLSLKSARDDRIVSALRVLLAVVRVEDSR